MSKRDFSPIAASLVLIAALFLLTVKSLEGQPGRFFLGTADYRNTEVGADGVTYMQMTPAGAITFPNSATMTLPSGTAVTGQVLTLPQINDTSSDHQYVFAVSELAADRTVTLPLLTGGDTFVFNDFAATLTNKTLTSPTLTTPAINGIPTGTFDDSSTFAYSAGNFTASSGDWTVADGEETIKYTLLGSSLMVLHIAVDTSTVSATPQSLRLTLPASKTCNGLTWIGSFQLIDNSTAKTGVALCPNGQTYVELRQESEGNLTAATDTTYVRGTLIVPVS